MSDVNDIPDNELLGRAVRGCRSRRGKVPMWSAIADQFSLGSTYSHQLCRRYGVDPEQVVGPRTVYRGPVSVGK